MKRRLSDTDEHTLHQLAAFTHKHTSANRHMHMHQIHVSNGWAWASDGATYAALPIELATPAGTFTIDPLEAATGQVNLTPVDDRLPAPTSPSFPIGPPSQPVHIANPTRVAYDLTSGRTKPRDSTGPNCVGAILPAGGYDKYSNRPAIIAPPAIRIRLDPSPFLSAITINIDLLARALRVWTDPVNLGIPAVSGQPVTVWPADTHGEDGHIAVMPIRAPIFTVLKNSGLA